MIGSKRKSILDQSRTTEEFVWRMLLGCLFESFEKLTNEWDAEIDFEGAKRNGGYYLERQKQIILRNCKNVSSW